MDHVIRVRIGKRIGNLTQRPAHGLNIRPWRVRELLRQRLALDQSHGKKHDAIEFVHGINGHNIRMR
jgi:hypothetical protein